MNGAYESAPTIAVPWDGEPRDAEVDAADTTHPASTPLLHGHDLTWSSGRAVIQPGEVNPRPFLVPSPVFLPVEFGDILLPFALYTSAVKRAAWTPATARCPLTP